MAKQMKRVKEGSLGSGPGKGFERVSFPMVWAWATHFS